MAGIEKVRRDVETAGQGPDGMVDGKVAAQGFTARARGLRYMPVAASNIDAAFDRLHDSSTPLPEEPVEFSISGACGHTAEKHQEFSVTEGVLDVSINSTTGPFITLHVGDRFEVNAGDRFFLRPLSRVAKYVSVVPQGVDNVTAKVRVSLEEAGGVGVLADSISERPDNSRGFVPDGALGSLG